MFFGRQGKRERSFEIGEIELSVIAMRTGLGNGAGTAGFRGSGGLALLVAVGLLAAGAARGQVRRRATRVDRGAGARR